MSTTMIAERYVTATAAPTRPVAVADLHVGDHVVVLGTVVEILGVRGHKRFPGACRIRMRTLPAGATVETLLPARARLTGLYLPRQLAMRCTTCGITVLSTVDLVLGRPAVIRCLGCAATVAGHTAQHPTIQLARAA